MNDPDLLTVSQVAEACNATNQTIRNWIKNGSLRSQESGIGSSSHAKSSTESAQTCRAQVGEGPWDYSSDEPPGPLPRKVRGTAPRRGPDRRSAGSVIRGLRAGIQRGARGVAFCPSRPRPRARRTPASAGVSKGSPTLRLNALRRARPPIVTGSNGPRPAAARSRRMSLQPGYRPPGPGGSVGAVRRGGRRARPGERGTEHARGWACLRRARGDRLATRQGGRTGGSCERPPPASRDQAPPLGVAGDRESAQT